MAKARLQPVISFLRRVIQPTDASRVADAQLLERFVKRREEAAFELLVWRHERLVLGVCQRMLHDWQDVEDAFQATFLILVRKARSIGKRESLASWLYKVAFRCALRAKARAHKRTSLEKHGMELSTVQARSEPTADMVWRDLRPILDQEINSLPEKYRRSVVLCYLEGKTYGEAASELGCSLGTISTRLTRARELLRTGLARHGLVLSSGALAMALCAHAASAAVPAALVDSAVRTALLFAAGKVVTGTVSDAAILAQGVLKTMFLNKLKIAALYLLAVGGAGAAGLLTHGLLAGPANPAQAQAGKREWNQKPKVTVRRPAQPTQGEKEALPQAKSDGPQIAPKRVVVRQDAILQRMALSPTGDVLATVGVVHDGSTFNSTVKLWDARTGRLKRALDEEKDSHLEITFSRDLLAIAVHGKLTDTNKPLREVRLLDARTLKLNHKIDEILFPGVRGWGPLAFSPDGKRLAVTGYGEGAFLKLWDVSKEKFMEAKADLGDIPREQIQARCLAFSPDGKLVAAAWDDGKIRLFDGQTGELRTLLHIQLKHEYWGIGVGAIAFSPDSKTLASKGNDNTVALWDLTEGKPPRGEPPNEKKIKQLIANLDADEFATREKASKELEKLGKSAEGTMREALAAAGRSPEAKRRLEQLLKDIQGKPQRTLKGQTGDVDAIAYSSDGRWIAIGSQTAKAGVYEVILRDAKTGEVKQTFSGLTEWIHVVVFSPDGKTLAVCGGGGRAVDDAAGEGKPVKTSGEITLLRLE